MSQSYDDTSGSNVRSGFWNSITGDIRTYYNSDFSTLMSLLINDGVFQNFGGYLRVTPGSEDFVVTVKKGEAWFDNVWIRNETDLAISIDPSPVVSGYSRRDLIAIKVDHSDNIRKGTIEYITGTAGTNPSVPSPVDTDEIFYHPLASVLIRSTTTVITDSEITNYIGTTTTPFITGILKTIDITELLTQWSSQFTDWMNAEKTEYESWKTTHENDFESWETTQKSGFETWRTNEQDAFDTWFENIQYILDGDVAGHLQNEINDIISGAIIEASEFDDPVNATDNEDSEELVVEEPGGEQPVLNG